MISATVEPTEKSTSRGPARCLSRVRRVSPQRDPIQVLVVPLAKSLSLDLSTSPLGQVAVNFVSVDILELLLKVPTERMMDLQLLLDNLFLDLLRIAKLVQEEVKACFPEKCSRVNDNDFFVQYCTLRSIRKRVVPFVSSPTVHHLLKLEDV